MTTLITAAKETRFPLTKKFSLEVSHVSGGIGILTRAIAL